MTCVTEDFHPGKEIKSPPRCGGMASVMTGPGSALRATPADITPFPGDGGSTESREGGQMHRVARKESQVVISPTEDANSHLGTKNCPEINTRPSKGDYERSNATQEWTPISEDRHHDERGPCSGAPDSQPLLNNVTNGTQRNDTEEHRMPQTSGTPPTQGSGRQSTTKPPDVGTLLAAELARLDLKSSPEQTEIRYVGYESELQMPWIMALITEALSEPYSIYTYRYFIHNWPQLCFLAMAGQECVGAIVCKLDTHKRAARRGYIAMLAVDDRHRRKGIATALVKKSVYAMVEGNCDEVVLEAETTNGSALALYENLGFVRDKRLFRYYLNGVDAFRLKLWLR